MPPRKKPVVRTQIELYSDDDAGSGESTFFLSSCSLDCPLDPREPDNQQVFAIKANVDPARQGALTKRAVRNKATTSAAAEKKALPTARLRRKTVDLTDDDMDPIEDDEMEDTVVVEPETGLRKKGSRKTTAKSEPARKESARRKAGKAVETEPDREEQTESDVPDPEEPKLTRRGGKKVSGKEDVPVTSASENKKRMTKKGRDAPGKEREIAETQFETMEVDPSEHSVTEDEGLEIAPTPTQVHQAGMRGVVIDKASASTGKGRGRPKRMDKSAVEEVHTEEDDDLIRPTKVPGGKGKKNPANGSGEKGEVYRDLEKAYQALRIRYNSLQEAKETEAEQALKAFQKNMKEKDEGCDLSHIFYIMTTDNNDANREISGN